MRTDEFWLILQRAGRERRSESESLAALTAELQRLGDIALREFEDRLQREIAALNVLPVRDVAEQLWVLTDESWLHLRAWCVSQGRAYVDHLLAEPSAVLRALAEERGGPFDPPNGELFLYCADYARVAAARAVA